MTFSDRAKALMGALMIVIAAGLVGLLMVYDDQPIAAGQRYAVDFARVANLRPGADVRLFGRTIGVVTAVRQRDKSDAAHRARVRVEFWVEEAWTHSLWKNAELFINADNIIGDRHLEIGPPPGKPSPASGPGTVWRGTDPPDLDAFFNRTFASVQVIWDLAQKQGPRFSELIARIKALGRHVEMTFPRRNIPLVYARLLKAFAEIVALDSTIRRGTKGGALNRRLLARVRALLHEHGLRLGALRQGINDVSADLARLQRVVDPSETRKLLRARRHFAATLARVHAIQAKLAAVLLRLRIGRGSLGRMLKDPELGDDIKDMHRILKERPWRALGKPNQDRAPRGVRRRPKPRKTR